jgi:hypothetical protein
MSTPQKPMHQNSSHEERALFARLAAMNSFFEAARAGVPAQDMAARALSSEQLLATFLEDLKSSTV